MNRRSVIRSLISGVALSIFQGAPRAMTADHREVVMDYIEQINSTQDSDLRRQIANTVLAYIRQNFPKPVYSEKIVQQTHDMLTINDFWIDIEQYRKNSADIPNEIYPIYVVKYMLQRLRVRYHYSDENFSWFHDSYGKLIKQATLFRK